MSACERGHITMHETGRQHLKELIPIIYTPTQGDAIANYSHLFRRSEGLFLTYGDGTQWEEEMEEAFLEQTRGRDLQLFVASDAEAILGIGDQGVGVSSSNFTGHDGES